MPLKTHLEGPRLASARYEAGLLKLEIAGALSGAGATVQARDIPFLAGASDEQLADIKITASGNAIHWPSLNEDISASRLLELIFGLYSPGQRRNNSH